MQFLTKKGEIFLCVCENLDLYSVVARENSLLDYPV